MKRQETLRSSSSRRDTDSADHHSTPRHAVDSGGCMAGVFQLISSKYLTRRKFLTFGKRQTASFSFSSPHQPNPKSPARKGRVKNRDRLVNGANAKNGFDEDSRELPRLSCQVPRSPTIPPEFRRSGSIKSPENLRSTAAPSVVARLMGLEDAPPDSAPRTPDSAAEKRRKLLGALEKCDGDLQTLKRIIEAVRSTDQPETQPSPPLVSVAKDRDVMAAKQCTDQMSWNGSVEQEQPSPVSVLEDFTESPPPALSTGGCYSVNRPENVLTTNRGRRAISHQQQRRKAAGENNTEMATFRFHIGQNLRPYIPRSLFRPRSHRAVTASPPPSSAMLEAVKEACRDVERAQRSEIERIALVMEDFVYRDLIQGFINELMGHCSVFSPLPLDKCKRKLRF